MLTCVILSNLNSPTPVLSCITLFTRCIIKGKVHIFSSHMTIVTCTVIRTLKALLLLVIVPPVHTDRKYIPF